MMRTSKQIPLAAIGCGLVVAFALGYLAGKMQTCRAPGTSAQDTVLGFIGPVAPAAYNKAFQLVIWVELKPGTSLKWLQLWQALAKHVKENEPCTLSYEASVDETNPNRIIVFERYCSKRDLTEVHQKSAPFLLFRQQMAELDPYVRKEGAGLTETGIGYMVRQDPTPGAADADSVTGPITRVAAADDLGAEAPTDGSARRLQISSRGRT